ncbi:hypothetical protein LY78DRAFT_65946 [Colletotrichum sublineola]|nr:hypothetical protein LY78DRAFT_65946 [Colletotrichum sublineola]
MERPELQLHELQVLQKQHMRQMQEGPQRYEDGGLASSEEEAEQVADRRGGGERGLRDFNYNGRVRNGEPGSQRASSGVLGQHHPPPRNSVSNYSTYSSYPPSLDGAEDHGQDGRGVEGDDLGGGAAGGNSSGFGRGAPPPRPPRSPPPPLPHIAQPKRQPSMEVPPAPGTANTVNTIGTDVTVVAGTESVQKVRQPPPTYVPSQDHYNRVRFVDEVDRGPSPRPVDKAQIKGCHSTRLLWMYACCAYFCYRCVMDEDF